METLNASTLKDLTNEIQSKTDLLDLVSSLSDQSLKDRKDVDLRSRSIGKDKSGHENYQLQKRIEELQDKIKDLEYSKSTRKEQVNRDLMHSLNEADSQVADLRRKLEMVEEENNELRENVRRMVDDFSR